MSYRMEQSNRLRSDRLEPVPPDPVVSIRGGLREKENAPCVTGQAHAVMWTIV